MKLKEDQARIKDLLKDTITLLCKNGLHYKSRFSVEALIGITLDEEDVFLVNIKESVGELQVDVNLQKAGTEETDGESENDNHHRSPTKNHENKKHSRKRPPDGSPSFSDLPSPAKHSRTEMDDASNTSEMSKDSMFNIKAEPEDDLVFVKEEGSEYRSCSQSQPSFMMQSPQTGMTQQGFPTNPTFPPQSFDTTPADALPGMSSWNPDQANVSGAQTFSSPGSAQQCVCPLCGKGCSGKQYLLDHQRAVHQIGDPFKCQCGSVIWWRSSYVAHRKTCKVVISEQQKKS